jgi:hypothetical protein
MKQLAADAADMFECAACMMPQLMTALALHITVYHVLRCYVLQLRSYYICVIIMLNTNEAHLYTTTTVCAVNHCSNYYTVHRC